MIRRICVRNFFSTSNNNWVERQGDTALFGSPMKFSLRQPNGLCCECEWQRCAVMRRLEVSPRDEANSKERDGTERIR